MSKEKQGIDLLKFIGSIMIFTIHMAVFESFGEVQSAWELLGRWAVPVFFIASAYFLFSANNGSVEYANIKKYIYRIGMLYLFWFIFNLPNFICVRFLKRPPHTMYDFLMIAKNSVLSSTFTGSWYLLSSIFCAWLLFVLKKKMNTKQICLIAILFQIICIFTSVYKGILPDQIRHIFSFWQFPLNIFGGLFYFAIGLFLAENQDLIYKAPKWKYSSIAVMSFLTYIGDINFAKHFAIYGGSDEDFSLIPLSVSVFILGMRSSVKIRNAKKLRNISTIIYCAQADILLAKVAISRIFGINFSLFLFGICSVIMVCIIAAVFWLQERKIWWAKYLT